MNMQDVAIKATDLAYDLLDGVLEQWLVAGLQFALDEGPDPGPPPTIHDIELRRSGDRLAWVFERQGFPSIQ